MNSKELNNMIYALVDDIKRKSIESSENPTQRCLNFVVAINEAQKSMFELASVMMERDADFMIRSDE